MRTKITRIVGKAIKKGIGAKPGPEKISKDYKSLISRKASKQDIEEDLRDTLKSHQPIKPRIWLTEDKIGTAAFYKASGQMTRRIKGVSKGKYDITKSKHFRKYTQDMEDVYIGAGAGTRAGDLKSRYLKLLLSRRKSRLGKLIET